VNKMRKQKAKRKNVKTKAKRPAKRQKFLAKDRALANLETDFTLFTFYGFSTFRWPAGCAERLRKYGVLSFVNSDIEKSSPDLREWLQLHYLSLDVDSKVFVGGVKDGLERLQLRGKKLANINADFRKKTTDRRLKDCWSYMECHARQCLSAFISDEKLDLVDNVSQKALELTCEDSSSNVLSVFVYDAKPTGSVICPDHVDRGFITCTTNQNGGLEVFVGNRWLAIPPTKGLICFTGYALHKISGGKVPMVRHRVVSVSPEKQRISIAFKLRPDSFRSVFCGSLNQMMEDFELEYRSVNQPCYEDHEAPSAIADWALVGTSSLRTSAYLKHCVTNGIPWQQKPTGLLWQDFCKSWNEKVRVWAQKQFKIWSGISRGVFRYLSRVSPTQRKWSDLLTDAELVYPGDIRVCDSDPRTSPDWESESLGPIIELFKDFVPRWGEVFEMYALQNDAITLEPEFLVHERLLRGD